METRSAVGVVWPSEPTAREIAELHRLVPEGMGTHMVTVDHDPDPGEGITLERVVGLAESPTIEQTAAELVPKGVSGIAYACTSASYVRGVGGDRDIADRIAAATGLPATTTSSATVLALRHLGVTRVAVLSPHIDPINERLRRFLEGSGFEVVAMKGLKKLGDIDRIPPESISELVVQDVDRPDADGVFISCTSMQTAAILGATEEKIGKPVVSALQATVWELLRLAGAPYELSGLVRV